MGSGLRGKASRGGCVTAQAHHKGCFVPSFPFQVLSTTKGKHLEQILSSLDFPFQASPQSFKTSPLKRGFHTLIKDVSFSSPTDVGSHRLAHGLGLCKLELRTLPLFDSSVNSFRATGSLISQVGHVKGSHVLNLLLYNILTSTNDKTTN